MNYADPLFHEYLEGLPPGQPWPIPTARSLWPIVFVPGEISIPFALEFGAWLDQRGDERGELLRIRCELAELSPASPLPVTTADLDTEAGFWDDMAERPRVETPWLICADWLEERGELDRARQVRLLGRLRVLSAHVSVVWAELFWVRDPHPGYAAWSDLARRVLQFANQAAQRFNHDCVATCHALLGLLRLGTGPAVAALTELGLTVAIAESEVERVTPSGPDMVTMGKLPMTTGLYAVTRHANEEAQALRHELVTPEHVLLGLCRAQPSVAVRVLHNLGIAPRQVCERVLTMLGCDARAWVRAHPEEW
jgi:uncharacterized protein (TIGR02996 family)